MSHARYLGDGVYAHFNGYSVVLTTGHHDPAVADNIIEMEPQVMGSLKRYETDLIEHLKANPNDKPEQI